MTYLYGGKILRVDLSRREVSSLPSEDYAQGCVGGRGFNARLLWELLDPSTDTLGSKNVISLAAGPLAGTLFPCCGSTDIACKSPLTGLIGNAVIGGDWSGELSRRAGTPLCWKVRPTDPSTSR